MNVNHYRTWTTLILKAKIDNLESTTSLTQRFRQRTSELHVAAEASGIVAALMRGQITRSRYALYLRNLLPAYQVMEAALQRDRGCSIFAGLAHPFLYRAERIVADLKDLKGSDWAGSLPLLTSGKLYADRVTWASHSDLLIAHCYTRYLGDLNGGRVLKQRILKQFGPDFPGVSFLTFPDIPDLDEFRTAYRGHLDSAGRYLSDASGVVEETAIAFQLNIALSRDVNNWCGPDDSGNLSPRPHTEVPSANSRAPDVNHANTFYYE